MSVRLPVFHVSPTPADARHLERLGSNLFGAEQFEIREFDDRVVARSDSIIVELDKVSGGIRAADEESLREAVSDSERKGVQGGRRPA